MKRNISIDTCDLFTFSSDGVLLNEELPGLILSSILLSNIELFHQNIQLKQLYTSNYKQ